MAARPASGAVAKGPHDVVEAATGCYLRGEPLDMSALATQLGIGRATLYRWVGNREELLARVIAETSERTFRTVVKDYFTVCESYYTAIKRASVTQIEALDMGRRALHNEGSDLLRERLEGKIGLDQNTARRLFTLICVLHIRG